MVERVVSLFVPPVVTPRSPPTPQSFPLVPRPTASGRQQIAITRIDHSGRVGDLWLIDALDWRADDRHEIRTLPDGIRVFLDDTGRFRLNSRRHVFIPAGVRDALQIRAGDPVVLIADIEHRTLTIYPTGVVVALLAAHHDRDTEVPHA
jgi:hypothetical protein